MSWPTGNSSSSWRRRCAWGSPVWSSVALEGGDARQFEPAEELRGWRRRPWRRGSCGRPRRPCSRRPRCRRRPPARRRPGPRLRPVSSAMAQGAGGEGLHLEDAHGAVPEHGLGGADLLQRRRPRSRGRCPGPSARRGCPGPGDGAVRVGLELGGHHVVQRAAAGACPWPRPASSSSRARSSLSSSQRLLPISMPWALRKV